MSEWKVLTAEEFCDSVRDGTHDTPRQVECGYKLVTAKHISNGQIDLSDAYLISESDYLKINERSKVERWDVLMSMIGNGLGKSAVVKDNPQYAIKNLALFKIGDETRAKWLHYYLSSNKGQGFIYNSLQGSGQPFISLSLLRKFPIPVPDDEKIMRNVVAILSRYDSLIENYQKQIKLLEEAAQRLYKEWFVDLHFPDHENTKIVDGVPEGWEKKPVDSIYSIKYGKNLSTKLISESGEFPVYGANGVIGYYDKANCNEQVVLITSRGNGSGDVLMTYHKDAFITNNSFIVSPLEDYSYCQLPFTYQFLKNANFRAVRTGAAQPQLTNQSIHTVDVVLPSKDVIIDYCDKASYNNKKIILLKNQIRLLTEARDRLLPKLMSDEISMFIY